MARSDRPVDLEPFLAARSKALLRVGFALTGDWQRAEDLLQTALLQCYARWGRLEDPEAYLRKTIVRTYLGWRRRRWSAEVSTDPSSMGEFALEHDDQSQETVIQRQQLLAALSELPRRQRAVVVLRFYLDLDERAVADALGVSVGTVKSQAHRALAKLNASAHLTNALDRDRG